MSKKSGKKPDREVGLPEWADDVTPADEVMQKFYAPTGSFSRGPLLVPVAPAAPPPPEPSAGTPHQDPAKDVRVKADSLPDSNKKPVRNKLREDRADPAVIERETYVDGGEGETVPAGTIETIPASVPFPKRIDVASPEPPAIPQGSVPSSLPAPKVSDVEPRPISFEEFARLWKKFLYPGQMSVMRELYEMTVPHGAPDCFTRYSELASLTRMSRRNCINVVNSLVSGGFVDRVEIKNDATGKGIRLRIHLDPIR